MIRDSDIFNVDFSNLSPMSVIEENDFIQDMINSGMEFPTQCDGTTIEQEVSQKESKNSLETEFAMKCC